MIEEKINNEVQDNFEAPKPQRQPKVQVCITVSNYRLSSIELTALYQVDCVTYLYSSLVVRTAA